MSTPLDYSRIPDPWHELERELDRELVRLQRKRWWLLTMSFVAALVASLICIGAALAHDAPPTPAQPLGWTYPWSCCSGMDCVPKKNGVRETKDGYVIDETGELIPYGDKKIKDSPDGMFHWCSHVNTDHKTICLFVPPRGM